MKYFLPFILIALIFVLIGQDLTSQSKDETQYITGGRVPSPIEMIDFYFEEDAETFKKIVTCESGWNNRAVSETGDFGLTQVNLQAHRNKIPGKYDTDKIDWLMDPRNSVRLAYRIYQTSWLYPWTCFNKI